MSDETKSGVLSDLKVRFPETSWTNRTLTRLGKLDVSGTGLGRLTPAVGWAGRVRGTDRPEPFEAVRGFLVAGEYPAGFVAGGAELSGLVAAVQDGTAVVARLADRAGVPVRVIDAGAAGKDGDGELLDADSYAGCLQRGRELAEAAIDEGADLLVLGALGVGAESAAIGVSAHLTRTEFVELSPRLVRPGGMVDDASWMVRTAALRDALAGLHGQPRNAETTVRGVGGPVLAVLAAMIVTAAARRTPVLIDGPIGFTAALVARDVSLASPKWCYAPDRLPHPVVAKIAKQTGMPDDLGIGVDIGEGCAALAALPTMQQALRLTADLSVVAEEAAEEPVTDTAGPARPDDNDADADEHNIAGVDSDRPTA